jgi:hypothetical protein
MGTHALFGQVAQADVDGLTAALASKLDASDASVTNARTPTAHAASHADGGSDEISVDASQVTAGTLAIGRIPTGTTGSTVALGNAAPTAHAASHTDGGSDEISIDGSQVTTGLITTARMPRVFNPIRSGNVTTTTQSDASTTAGNFANIGVNGNATVLPPTNPADFQQFKYHLLAVGADRTITFDSAIIAAPGLPDGNGPYTITRGKVLVAMLEYIGNRGTPPSSDTNAPVWALMAAAVI